jgi:hypothetical protein
MFRNELLAPSVEQKYKPSMEIVASLVKARIVELAETAVAMKRFCKHPLLGNESAINITVGSGVFCAFRAE